MPNVRSVFLAFPVTSTPLTLLSVSSNISFIRCVVFCLPFLIITLMFVFKHRMLYYITPRCKSQASLSEVSFSRKKERGVVGGI